mgnify:CR=1 FL=1
MLSALPELAPPSKTRLVAKTKSLGPDDIEAAINRLTEAISQSHSTTRNLILLGIANGGLELNRRLAAKLGVKNTGTIDISFYRDDIGRNPIPKELAPSHISTDVHGATVILVDDVLFSGRTINAALNELFDHGRPAKVELAVLVDRGGRKLPVAADYTGMMLKAGPTEKVVVRLDRTSPTNDFIRIEARGRKPKPSNR